MFKLRKYIKSGAILPKIKAVRLNFLFLKKNTAAGCARVKGILTPPYYIEYYPIITYKILSKND